MTDVRNDFGKNAAPQNQGVSYDLDIGSIILCRPDKIIGDGYAKPGNRPALVQALWRDESRAVRQVELLYFSTHLNKIYSSDYSIRGGRASC